MKTSYPVLPLRDIVVFPHMIVPLFVGRDKSVAALEAAMADDKEIFLVAQLDPSEDDPGREDLYDTGVTAEVLQLLKLPDGTVRVLVAGKERGQLDSIEESGAFLTATVREVTEDSVEGAEVQALMRSVVDQFENYAKLNRKLPSETAVQLAELDDASRLADAVAANIAVKVSDKQALLIEVNPHKRLEMVFAFMEGELGVLQVEKKIRSRVKRQMEKTQREYYLNEQLKAIQRELGNEGEEGDGDEIAELTQKIATLKLSKEARTKAQGELKKLRTMAPMSAEATVVRNYLDVLLGLPWGKKSKLKKDLVEAERVLDEDHYGLEKVKDRIVEYLAVQTRTNKLKGPILCLVGPPGVGKTSLGKSIAKATGREFIRQSLGGVRDEAEIRGHRRTYIGSLPGKIVTNLRKAGTSNPLFLLDEIDKLGQDFRGDPASALLEVLDPEQNSRFQDHYLEIDVDLSDVMFVTTANTLNLPQPLLDRMEIIRLEGYTEDEKVEIAERHLIAKQVEAHGLKEGEFTLTHEGLRALIQLYTREAGVRTLEREIARLARKVLRRILEGKTKRVTITPENLSEFAGVRKYTPRPLRGGEPDRRRHRARLDRGRRRTADDRKRHGRGKGCDQDHRQAGRRDEGIGRGGAELRQGARADLWHQAQPVRAQGHPRPLARRRGSQGWPLGGHRPGHFDRLDSDGHPRAARNRDDRRGDASGTRAADRRAQGEAARRAPWRHRDRADPRREREGPRRDSREHQGWAQDRARQARRRGAALGAHRAADSDRLERRRRARRAPAERRSGDRRADPPALICIRSGLRRG